MSPSEYVARCVRGFNRLQHHSFSEEQIRSSRKEHLIDKYKDLMLKGEKFPMPILDFSQGFTQEGLHRVIAAERLKVKQIPAMVVRRHDESSR